MSLTDAAGPRMEPTLLSAGALDGLRELHPEGLVAAMESTGYRWSTWVGVIRHAALMKPQDLKPGHVTALYDTCPIGAC